MSCSTLVAMGFTYMTGTHASLTYSNFITATEGQYVTMSAIKVHHRSKLSKTNYQLVFTRHEVDPHLPYEMQTSTPVTHGKGKKLTIQRHRNPTASPVLTPGQKTKLLVLRSLPCSDGLLRFRSAGKGVNRIHGLPVSEV